MQDMTIFEDTFKKLEKSEVQGIYKEGQKEVFGGITERNKEKRHLKRFYRLLQLFLENNCLDLNDKMNK